MQAVNSTHLAPTMFKIRETKCSYTYADNRPNNSISIRSAASGTDRIWPIISVANPPYTIFCNIASIFHHQDSSILLNYNNPHTVTQHAVAQYFTMIVTNDYGYII